jgi:hypothetical protein
MGGLGTAASRLRTMFSTQAESRKRTCDFSVVGSSLSDKRKGENIRHPGPTAPSHGVPVKGLH